MACREPKINVYFHMATRKYLVVASTSLVVDGLYPHPCCASAVLLEREFRLSPTDTDAGRSSAKPSTVKLFHIGAIAKFGEGTECTMQMWGGRSKASPAFLSGAEGVSLRFVEEGAARQWEAHLRKKKVLFLPSAPVPFVDMIRPCKLQKGMQFRVVHFIGPTYQGSFGKPGTIVTIGLHLPLLPSPRHQYTNTNTQHLQPFCSLPPSPLPSFPSLQPSLPTCLPPCFAPSSPCLPRSIARSLTPAPETETT